MLTTTDKGKLICECGRCGKTRINAKQLSRTRFCGQLLLEDWNFFVRKSPDTEVDWYCPNCLDTYGHPKEDAPLLVPTGSDKRIDDLLGN